MNPADIDDRAPRRMLARARAEVPAVATPQAPRLAAEQLEALAAQARRAGFEQGRQEGLLRADTELQELRRRLEDRMRLELEQQRKSLDARHAQEVEAIRHLAAELQRQTHAARAVAAADAVDLAHAALTHVLRERVTAAERAASAVAHVRGELAPERPLKIWLHPQDLALVPHLLEQSADIAWLPDPQLARGSCRAATRFGEIESRMHARVAALQTLWIERVGAFAAAADGGTA